MNINLGLRPADRAPESVEPNQEIMKSPSPGVMFALMTWWKRRQIRLNYGPGYTLMIARDYKPSSGGKNWWHCRLINPDGDVVASDYSPTPGGKWTAAWDCMNKYIWRHPSTVTRNEAQTKPRKMGV